jgi:glucosamine-6-phosphate deaminase
MGSAWNGESSTAGSEEPGAKQAVTGAGPMEESAAPGTRMTIRVFGTSRELGDAAAKHTAEVLCSAMRRGEPARMIMATGNSQLEFVQALRNHPEVPWGDVTVFHMDEYMGMPSTHPASFARWLREKVSDWLQPGTVHYIDGEAPDLDVECRRYEELLREAPIALTCMGIGENGHVAFNEPEATDFGDDHWMRLISLDEASRVQQVVEGHFSTVTEVPEKAITLTVPVLLSGRVIQVVVPGARKANAVRRALHGPVSPSCPASILRLQANATLFLDQDSNGPGDRGAGQ